MILAVREDTNHGNFTAVFPNLNLTFA